MLVNLQETAQLIGVSLSVYWFHLLFYSVKRSSSKTYYIFQEYIYRLAIHIYRCRDAFVFSEPSYDDDGERSAIAQRRNCKYCAVPVILLTKIPTLLFSIILGVIQDCA